MKNIFYVFLICILYGCLADNIVRKPSGILHEKQNQYIYNEISKEIKTGDWLAIRGYHGIDNLVAGATGIPISHVGVYDADSMLVIEADASGVHSTPIREFIDKS